METSSHMHFMSSQVDRLGWLHFVLDCVIIYIFCSLRNPGQKDEFDSMLDKAPENINYIKRNLLQFCNSLLKNFGIKVENLSEDFSNGINLIMLIGMVEGRYPLLLTILRTCLSPTTY